MSDPVGLIGGAGGAGPIKPGGAGGSQRAEEAGAPDFRQVLMDNLQRVNAAQQEADQAVEDLVTGRRSDLEGVIVATQKADDAFKMLQAMRGKVLRAYEDIKSIRV